MMENRRQGKRKSDAFIVYARRAIREGDDKVSRVFASSKVRAVGIQPGQETK